MEGKVLVFIVPRPLGQCDFEKLLSVSKTIIHIIPLLIYYPSVRQDMKKRNLNEPLLYNKTKEVHVRFSAIRIKTVLGLSAAMQFFNAISIFYKVVNLIYLCLFVE